MPGRPDLVYVADYERGIDVVKLDDGGRGAHTVTPAQEAAVAPTPAGVRVPGLGFAVKGSSLRLHAHEDFGQLRAVPSRA